MCGKFSAKRRSWFDKLTTNGKDKLATNGKDKLTTNGKDKLTTNGKKEKSLGKSQYPFVLSLSKDEWILFSHTL